MVTIRVNNFVEYSRANGNNSVLWVQGCNLRCEGCFNPGLWTFKGGQPKTPNQIIEAMPGNSEGLTITGGEPFLQENLIDWLVEFRRLRPALRIIVLTGFNREELDIDRIEKTKCIDVLIAGRYVQEKRIASNLAGSSNKEHIFITDRLNLEFFENLPRFEIALGDKSIFATGMIDSREISKRLEKYGVNLEVVR